MNEGYKFTPEDNEESFNNLSKKINEKVHLYKSVISSFFSEVALPDKYKEYQDQLDSEAFLCLTRIKELRDLAEKEFKELDSNYKPIIDDLFDVPIKTLNTQLEVAKIMLDNKSFDVWQKKHIEFNNEISEIEKIKGLTPEVIEKLNSLKNLFDNSMQEMFEAKDEQLHKLQDLFSSSQLQNSKVISEGKAGNLNTEINKYDKLVSHYSIEIYKLIDSFDFNTREIMEQAFSDFNSEKNNLN